MNQIARRPMSLDEFLAWERAQEDKYEFDGAGPVAMTGGTLAHRAVADDLNRLLNDRLVGRGCRAFAGDVKILVAGRVRYPDVVVTCAKLDLSADIVPEPIVVIEVLSPSTARTDRILKLEEYRRTTGIQNYLLLEQEAAEGVLFTRDGDTWRVTVLMAPADVVLNVLDVTIPLNEIYRSIIAPDAAPAPP